MGCFTPLFSSCFYCIGGVTTVTPQGFLTPAAVGRDLPGSFVLYTNDIGDQIDAQLGLFAGASALYGVVSSNQDAVSLQRHLDNPGTGHTSGRCLSFVCFSREFGGI